MSVVTEPSAVVEHLKWRRPRNQFTNPSSETDPNPRIPSITQSARSKPTISKLLHSSLCKSGTDETIQSSNDSSRKKNFTATSFRGFGCTADASQQVSVPAVIRTSADWQGKKTRKKKNKKNGSKNNNSDTIVPAPFFARKAYHEFRKHSITGFTEILPQYPMYDAFGTPTYYCHASHTSSEDFAEMMMLHRRLLTGGMFDSLDQFRDWRLDVDNMSYEELLELGERIGRVNTGLKENEVSSCIWKIQLPILNNISAHQVDRKCSICQEEYEVEDELGKLHCGHGYHMEYIRQWLGQKNFCPVCKAEVVVLAETETHPH